MLELEVGEDSIERERKETGLGLFIKGMNIKRPPRGRLGLAQIEESYQRARLGYLYPY